MTNNWNCENANFEEYDYISQEKQNKYYKHSFNPKSKRINNFISKKSQKFQIYKKNGIINENQNTKIDKYQPFYPKNYEKNQNQYSDKYNKYEYYVFSPKKNNDFFNYENSNFNYNYVSNKNETLSEKKGNEAEEIDIWPDNNNKKMIKEEHYQKRKKFGIKNIPHPKYQKGHGSCYISGKKLLPINHKKEEAKNNFIKKERKLSISSTQNNFDSAKHSISTLNTSSSSSYNKEKDVLIEEKKSNKNLENSTEETNFDSYNNGGGIIKNKFDENITEIKELQINKNFENTEILKVNVKLPNNKTVIFKLRRFDDLFLTIKLFCEINSIDEKFIKPIIIKSLRTINTIYQVYNCQITQKEASLLKQIKVINDNLNISE